MGLLSYNPSNMGWMRDVVPFHEEDAQAPKNSDMKSRGRNLFIVHTVENMLSNLGLLKSKYHAIIQL
jgi:hypothetical protein